MARTDNEGAAQRDAASGTTSRASPEVQQTRRKRSLNAPKGPGPKRQSTGGKQTSLDNFIDEKTSPVPSTIITLLLHTDDIDQAECHPEDPTVAQPSSEDFHIPPDPAPSHATVIPQVSSNWGKLRRALLCRDRVVLPTLTLGLFSLECLSACTYRFFSSVFSHFDFTAHLPVVKMSVKDLMGFDRTGDTRIWPGGEALARWILQRPEMVKGKRVMELGAGKLALPSIACCVSGVRRVDVTDGNEGCVQLLMKNLANIASECEVSIDCMLWGSEYCKEEMEHAVDVMVAGDAVFFEKQHDNLLNTVDYCLTREGEAYFCSPERKGSLDRFRDKVSCDGRFVVSEVEEFDAMLCSAVCVQILDRDLDWPKLILLRRA